MRAVSDNFLLNVAEVSAALVGLFLVGMFFYVETGFRRSQDTTGVVESYFRASTRIVLVLYAMAMGLSLALVVLEPVWYRLLFVALSVALVAANVATARLIGAVTRITGSRTMLWTEVFGSLAVVVIVVLPWALGGLHPDRRDLTWALLLSFAVGFQSICAAVLSAFDIVRSD